MSDISFRVQSLGKCYQIARAHTNIPYKTLQEDLLTLPRRLWSSARRGQPETEEFWALRNISFEVRQGEVLGIIGRNGAGKSTLLKILSNITEPTVGRAEIYGRVGSLLEVGTGFHPELTGRENIYLSGAILGMTRQEVKSKFDEIVAFAGVDRFIDTPAKHYSSGMYMRLAFAVAANLEPEILLVDEVLAVGDAEFQKKCLGKMGQVASEGRTVLFVSHNMVSIQQLCRRGLILRGGTMVFDGEVRSAVAAYTRDQGEATIASDLASRVDRKGSQWLKFIHVSVCDAEGHQISRILSGQNIRLRLYYLSQKELRGVSAVIATNITNERGYLLANLNSLDAGLGNLDIYRSGYFECNWPRFCFRAGAYTCDLFGSINGDIVDWVPSAFSLQVEDGDYFGTGRIIDRQQGEVLVDHSWSSVQSDVPEVS
jgi:lipopolysaccharide transport system ATP-binding protein